MALYGGSTESTHMRGRGGVWLDTLQSHRRETQSKSTKTAVRVRHSHDARAALESRHCTFSKEYWQLAMTRQNWKTQKSLKQP